MAFGKKKQEQEQPATMAAAPDEAPAPEAPEAISEELFAGDEPATEEAPESADEAPAAETPMAAAPEPAPAADPLGGDLLSMFSTTSVEADDKAALLELAGEVEMADLLEDMQTVAVALGISR
jgi:hypothetical protein